MSESVVQDWVSRLGLKKQTVLLQSLRGNDVRYLPNTKILQKWMRSAVYKNADPGHTFMSDSPLAVDADELDKELTYCTVHFAAHLAFGLEVLAYCHPHADTRKQAYELYSWAALEIFHMQPEGATRFHRRLQDRRTP